MTSYTTFMKHAEKVTKAKHTASRPVLQGAYHQTDGSVVVTDSHRLYKLFNGFQTTEAFIQNPKTGEHIDGNYPDMSRLLPDPHSAEHTFMVNVKELHDAAKAMFTAHKAINKSNKHQTLSFTIAEDSYMLAAGEDTDKFQSIYKIADAVSSSKETMNIHMQGQYLIDALALFKDAGEHEIKAYTYGNLRPFILESKDVTVLILPVRIN